MPHILIVEDDERGRDYLTLAMEDLGYEVSTASTGTAALTAIRDTDVDVVLLDIGLPDMDGIDVCRQMRGLTGAAIIFVSGRVDELDKVMALDAGGDDYVTKPFTATELAARIRAVGRRLSQGSTGRRDVLEAGPVVLDRAARTVLARGIQVSLTAREFDLLRMLMEQSPRVVRRQEILDALWGTDFVGDPNMLDGYILHLRQKLERNPHRPQMLQTVHGVGYRFSAPE